MTHPATALQLGKKIMAIPIRGQYEQQCNAEALKQMGLVTLAGIDENFRDHFYNWINNAPLIQKDYSNTIPQCLEYIFSLTESKTLTPVFFEEV